jgi:hypothetical protein
LLTALVNWRVNSIATAPPMLSDGVSPAEAAEIPRRSRSVVLGAATALVVSWFAPMFAALGMATIPLWLRLLTRMSAPASRGFQRLDGLRDISFSGLQGRGLTGLSGRHDLRSLNRSSAASGSNSGRFARTTSTRSSRSLLIR